MTFLTNNEFVIKYNMRAIDFDGQYGPQCFDLYRQYCREVLNIPQSPATGSQGAKVIWQNYLKGYFDAIPNSPLNSPQKGDIVIWGDKIGPFGHVAICVSGNLIGFTSFDQNWNNHPYCEQIKHSYKGVLGWLRRKKPVIFDTVPEHDADFVPTSPPNQSTSVQIPETTITSSETPNTSVEVISDTTPPGTLPTAPDVMPVNTSASLIVQLIRWLLRILSWKK